MKTTHINIWLLAAAAALSCSCSDWLELKPNNERVTDDLWKSKEDVEAVVTAGYIYMRDCVPTLIKWGELRGGGMYSTNGADTKLQDFNMTPSDALCAWSDMYKIINMANSVIALAPGVRQYDDTYYESRLGSHLCEAYFMRAYTYLTLLKNYNSVPLITEPYENDRQSFDKAKAAPEEIMAQIKADVKAALDTKAAKGVYETDWQTKTRVTKWALYALMADACLWNEDYQECIQYCDQVLQASDSFRPALIKNGSQWYEIFYPGLSNESILEMYWDYNVEQKTNNFASSLFAFGSARLRFTDLSQEELREETAEVLALNPNGAARIGRMGYCTWATSTGTSDYAASQLWLWKYQGTDNPDVQNVRQHSDANFIIYRVAEVAMIKAQAEAMLGNNLEAIRAINPIVERAGLPAYSEDEADVAAYSQLDLLKEILHHKKMEFFGEGKRWYDLLWLGRIAGGKYREDFINYVVDGNQTTNKIWVRTVLSDTNAWYLPVPQTDFDRNRLLEQNPYYGVTTTKRN